eukprot:10376902-Lingulodinium_polyedra.AAC.1
MGGRGPPCRPGPPPARSCGSRCPSTAWTGLAVPAGGDRQAVGVAGGGGAGLCVRPAGGVRWPDSQRAPAARR